MFLKLGLISFGGPIAHIGYFRDEFVTRRRWLDDATYTDIVALCQFLPGPASSQVGFAVGLMRARYLGGIAAWVGFTLPSAITLTLFAYGAHAMVGPVGAGLLHGLKLVAVAIVAQAVLGMARALCPDRQRATIAGFAMILILLGSTSIMQICTILFGAVAGLIVCRTHVPLPTAPMVIAISRRAGSASLAIFVLLLIGLPLAHSLYARPHLALFDAFYRTGALVFGGGHVVLPLLRDAFVAPGWISDNAFIAGYGAAQAVPGPLFTFAAYLGAVSGSPPNGIAGAALGLIGISLPGILLLVGALPFWGTLRTRASAQAAMRGINAAVVGLLAAAFYSPVWTSSMHTLSDLAVALIAFFLLRRCRATPFLVVVLCGVSGIILAHVP